MGLVYKTVRSPVGKLKLVASDKGLVAILWENEKSGRVPLSELQKNDRHPILLKTEQQLNEYFAGQRKQ
jgi:methylated-DNA-[protein]-cysteine S-methyltransferase